MPDKFKGLATIGAWVLFIMGLMSFVFAFVLWFSSPVFGEGPGAAGVWCAGDSSAMMGTVMVTLSVVIMMLRKKIE